MGVENGNARMTGELRRLADALSRLVREHFDLARAEIRADASRWGKDLAVGLAALPLAVLGLLLLEVAAAVLLSRAIGVPGALAAVGAVDLAIAGALGLFAARRFRAARRVALRGTAEELRLDREALRQVGRGEPPNGHAPLEVRPVLPETGRSAGSGPPASPAPHG